MLPGALVALHYAVQMLRPRWGYGSDVGGRRTPWIIGGMAMLALGGTLAALATVLMMSSTSAGILLAIAAFLWTTQPSVVENILKYLSAAAVGAGALMKIVSATDRLTGKDSKE